MTSTTTAPNAFLARPRVGLGVDVALAAVAFAGALAQISHGGIASVRPGSMFAPTGSRDLDLLGVLLTAASTLPLVAWRRDPLGVFTATAAASVLLAGLGYPLDLALGPAIALYLLAASRQPGSPWTRQTTIPVLGLFVAYLVAAAATEGAFPGTELLHSGLAWAVAWFAGERTRLRREHIADLQERATRAEREADRDRRLAAAEERARIARDLHDSAGHAINVIAVRAGAARLRHSQEPDRSLVALEAIEDLARQTAAEIDQIVHSLREGSSTNGATQWRRRNSNRARRARHADRAQPSSRADCQPRHLRHATGPRQRHRPSCLPDPPRSTHQRRPPRNRPRQNRSRLRRGRRRHHRHQPRARRQPRTIHGGTWTGRHARARHSPRRRPRYRTHQRHLPPPRPHPLHGPPPLIRVLVADDDHLMRAGLAELLTVDPDIDIVGQAATGREAVDETCRLLPDIVLMDIRMPDLDGIAATRELAGKAPDARILILTTFEEDDYVFGALRAGASGFLLKRTRPEELILAVHTIAAGDSLLSPSVTRRVVDRMAQQPTPQLTGHDHLDELTPRERQVLELIARGLSNREIASTLVVEESTIRTHVKRILMKLHLRDRVQAVIYAYETGLTHPAR